MYNVNVYDNSNDIWGALGTAVGMYGRYLMDGREERDASKALENQLIDRKEDQANQQGRLIGQLGANYNLGDKADADTSRQLLGQLSNLGVTGINQDNWQDAQQGILKQQDYWKAYNRDATVAQREANGGIGHAHKYISNAPSLFGW